MGRAIKQDKVKDHAAAPPRDEPDLTPEQRELLDSLHRSFQQAARGETRPFSEFMRELRLEREAEENAGRTDA
ncbi:MAG: hypothetical protein F4X02_15820 [Chloroflexi bacterium]|nr:hypothetical protein [Chloroflexota bacterium]